MIFGQQKGGGLKYIWYMIAVAVCSGALIVYFSTTSHQPDKNIVITINRKQITLDEFNTRFASVRTSAHNSDRHDFINSLIVKELMIQDAQKEGIDKDEAFRRSIQDYYEQSLVKQVMDKKIKSLKIDVSNEEIDRFNSFQNSMIKVTVFNASDENAVKKGQFRAQEARILRVNDLAGDIAAQLEVLKEGGLTLPLCSDNGCDVFRLDAVVTSHETETLSQESRKKLRDKLLERKSQKAMDSWISDLKAKSVIKISIK